MAGLESASPWIAGAEAAASIGVNLAELIGAGHRIKKETAELNALKQPFFRIQDEYFQNKNITAGEAMGGVGQSVKDFAATQRDKGLSTSISSMLQAGAMPGDITKLFDVYDSSVAGEAARDAEAHRQNIQMLMNANKDLAGQKTTAWGVNEFAPYERKLKQLTENITQEKMNKSAALQGIVSSIGSFGTSTMNNFGGGGAGKSPTAFGTTPTPATSMPGQ